MLKTLFAAFLALFAFHFGLAQEAPVSVTAEDLVGTWKLDEKLDRERLEEISGQPMPFPPSVKVTFEITGEQIVRADGTASHKSLRRTTIEAPQVNQVLAFEVQEDATWELQGNTIVSTTVSSEAKPANELARQQIAAQPKALDQIKPEIGRESKRTILSFDGDTLRVRAQMEDGTQLVYSLKRQ
ncbi:MAG: hypothetical protein ACFB21_09185 [Opitutales bacterium]